MSDTTAACAACIAMALVIAACIACAASILTGREQARTAVLRARWAWRCRGHPPVPDDGEKLTLEETRVLGNLDAGRDVRSRT